MAKLNITWTQEALDSFEKISLSIIKKWGFRPAKEFDDEVNRLLNHLQNNSGLCPPSKKKDIRKCVVSKQTSLIYRVKETSIQLIAFVDNRSEHHY